MKRKISEKKPFANLMQQQLQRMTNSSPLPSPKFVYYMDLAKGHKNPKKIALGKFEEMTNTTWAAGTYEGEVGAGGRFYGPHAHLVPWDIKSFYKKEAQKFNYVFCRTAEAGWEVRTLPRHKINEGDLVGVYLAEMIKVGLMDAPLELGNDKYLLSVVDYGVRGHIAVTQNRFRNKSGYFQSYPDPHLCFTPEEVAKNFCTANLRPEMFEVNGFSTAKFIASRDIGSFERIGFEYYYGKKRGKNVIGEHIRYDYKLWEEKFFSRNSDDTTPGYLYRIHEADTGELKKDVLIKDLEVMMKENEKDNEEIFMSDGNMDIKEVFLGMQRNLKMFGGENDTLLTAVRRLKDMGVAKEIDPRMSVVKLLCSSHEDIINHLKPEHRRYLFTDFCDSDFDKTFVQLKKDTLFDLKQEKVLLTNRSGMKERGKYYDRAKAEFFEEMLLSRKRYPLAIHCIKPGAIKIRQVRRYMEKVLEPEYCKKLWSKFDVEIRENGLVLSFNELNKNDTFLLYKKWPFAKKLRKDCYHGKHYQDGNSYSIELTLSDPFLDDIELREKAFGQVKQALENQGIIGIFDKCKVVIENDQINLELYDLSYNNSLLVWKKWPFDAQPKKDYFKMAELDSGKYRIRLLNVMKLAGDIKNIEEDEYSDEPGKTIII